MPVSELALAPLAHAVLLRFDEAAAGYAASGDRASVLRMRGLARDFGRYRMLGRIEALLPAAERLAPGERRRFLRERALPQLPIGGSALRGFAVDERALGEIAAELAEPVPALCAATVRLMLARGSRHAAKLYVLARLSGEEDLVRATAPELERRAADPRAALPATARAAIERAGGRVVSVLQEGDRDDYNPLSAHVFLAEMGRARVVVKENLRLPIDFSKIDGTSLEREVLEAAPHARIARLRGVLEEGRHELLLLDFAEGEGLERRLAPGALLPRAQALRAAADVAEALAHLHARLIVYLDVKGRNVLFDGRRATLVDFGMARPLAPGEEAVRSLLSTAEYVPPEMALGFSATRAADIFQLGILVHRLLAGAHPFAPADFPEGEGPRESELARFAVANVESDAALDEAALGPALAALVRRMLERDPGRRPGAAEVATALARMD